MSEPNRRPSWDAAFPVVLALVAGVLMAPIGRQDSHFGRMVLAGVGVALALLRPIVSETQRSRFVGALAAACVLGWFNYWQFDPDLVTGINDYVDTAYYYTNSKYLAELGYDGLYAGALLCDAERGSPRTKDVGTVRDLRDDVVRPVAEELDHGRLVKQAFTPERWTAFCGDMDWFLDRIDRKQLRSNFFVDHGYNPPPTWTVVGGNLAGLVDVEHLKLVCTADTVCVGLMFVALAWGLGLEAMLWSMLFFVVTFSGRWPILGMAILRCDWVAALAAAVAFLRREQRVAAGASLAYAALNRVFPALFFWGWLVEAVRDTVRERRLPARHLRFAAGAAVVTVLLTGTAAVEYGPTQLVASAEQLRLHNESFSSHRVGLATALVWRGETTHEDISAGGGMRARELTVQAMMPALHVVTLAFLALVAAFGWRTGRHGWELVPLVALPLFVATTPQVNYLNLRIVLFAWHGVHADRAFHRVMLALLLAVEVAAQAAQVADWERFPVNAVSSVGLCVYYAVLTGWLVVGVVRPEKVA